MRSDSNQRRDSLKIGTIGWGYLKFKDFKRFVDNYPRIKHIEISNSGEIFLNPDLVDIIKYSYLNGIDLTAGVGVNLNTINDETIECLVKYRVKRISVSLDGASNETYRIYRRRGDFNKVIKNIDRINYYKEKYHSKYPQLIWSFIIFGHNEHELPKARELSKKLNMEFLPAPNCFPYYSPVKNEEFVRNEIERYTAVEFREKNNLGFSRACLNLWESPQINWDGKLLGCPCNIYSDFGNVFEEGLKELLTSEKYNYAKKMLMGKLKPRADIPCIRCDNFRNEIERKAVIKELNSSLKYLF